MGTRADFYVGVGENANWLGSIAWDGMSVSDDISLGPQTEEEWVAKVNQFLASRDDSTFPDQGWPWPWDTSATTDYAYAWFEGKILISCFGHPWYEEKDYLDFINNPENDGADFQEKGATPIFPDMSSRKNVRWDKGSGLIIFGG